LVYEPGKFGLFDPMDVRERGSGILRRKVDIIARNSLHRTLWQRIEATAMRVVQCRSLTPHDAFLAAV